MNESSCTRLIAVLLTVVICNKTQADVTSLAGDWKFQLAPDDHGITEQWFKRHDFSDTIKLPRTTDQAGKGPLTQGSEGGGLKQLYARLRCNLA